MFPRFEYVGRRIMLRFSAPEPLVNKQKTLAPAEHVVKQRRVLGNKRYFPRWPTFEDLGQRIG